jgi:hypothetical protein
MGMDNLGKIIDASGGIFSRAQALDCGETDRSLTIAVREGSIVRLRRGIYAPADIFEACDDSGRHLLLARAALATQLAPRPLFCTGSLSTASSWEWFILYASTMAPHDPRPASCTMR